MNEKSEKAEKICNYCGAKFENQIIYCLECGKLIQNVSSKKKEPIIKKRFRTCKGCGSVIESVDLDQCPICYTLLDEVPKDTEISTNNELTLMFNSKGKKLELMVNKNRWNYKEGIKVFEFSILSYIFTYMIIMSFLMVLGVQSIEPSFNSLVLESLPRSSLIIYPLYYIISKKHNFSKFGFNSSLKNLLLALLVGIIGAILLLLLNFGIEQVVEGFISLGSPSFLEYNNNISIYRKIMGSSIIFVIIYLLISNLTIIAVELAYRGVLHPSLKAKFGPNIKSSFLVILISSFIYSGIETLFFFPTDVMLGLVVFLNYLTLFMVLGILYEFKSNLFTTIFAHIMFNIIWLIVFVFS